MKTILFLIFGAIILPAMALAQNDVIQKVVASDREQYDWFGDAVAISGDYAIVGAKNEAGLEGAAYIFEKNTEGEYTQVAKLTSSTPLAGAMFGRSVAIHGDIAIVGAPNDNSDETGNNFKTEAGSVFIFQRDGGSWPEVQKIVASDRDYLAIFGWSVAVSSDHILVGAKGEKKDESGNNPLIDAGAAYLFEKEGNDWTEAKKLVASDREEGDWFGEDVAIDGDNAIVGNPWEGEDENGANTIDRAGAVYVFASGIDDTWGQVQKIVAFDREDVWDQFGFSVDVSGNYMAVGANFRDHETSGKEEILDAGAVYMYKRSGNGIWEFIEQLFSSDASFFDEFGCSLGLDGDHLLVGAYSSDDYVNGIGEYFNAGAAYYFKKGNTDNWLEMKKIIAPIRAEYDYFGNAVDISSDGSGVIGAWGDDEDENEQNTMETAGAAYLWKSGTSRIAKTNFPGNVSVFPNPASEFISLTLNDYHDLEFCLTDVYGRVILQGWENNSKTISFDLAQIQEGIYFICIQSDMYYSATKFVKYNR